MQDQQPLEPIIGRESNIVKGKDEWLSIYRRKKGSFIPFLQLILHSKNVPFELKRNVSIAASTLMAIEDEVERWGGGDELNGNEWMDETFQEIKKRSELLGKMTPLQQENHILRENLAQIQDDLWQAERRWWETKAFPYKVIRKISYLMTNIGAPIQ